MKLHQNTVEIEDKFQSILKNSCDRVAGVKRFMEWWIADSSFRDRTDFSLNELWQNYGIRVDPEVLSYFKEATLARQENLPQPKNIPSALQEYSAFKTQLFSYRQKLWSQCGDEFQPNFQFWRAREIGRCFQEMPTEIAKNLPQAPVCFELSLGCSVGCWFCGLSAPSLKDIFLYTPANRQLWREVLQTVRDVIGVGAKYGFCYWASEPFDNPDYEKFCLDFYRVLGNFPTTTTALSLKQLDRTRNLLDLSAKYGGKINRFSILSLKSLERLHQHFTAEDLLFVEVVIQNKESLIRKSVAGRSRDYYLQNFDRSKINYDESSSLTSACVSGFLINMVSRTVKLISPCNADEKWPNGYRVYWEGTFRNAVDLNQLLKQSIAAQISVSQIGIPHL